jgi:molecular chaperone GrpE
MDNDTTNPTEAPEAAADGSPQDELARAREDAQKYLANWQRAEADFQNYKRRSEEERGELRKFSTAALLMNLLPVLDDFERAFSTLDRRLWDMTWFEGVQTTPCACCGGCARSRTSRAC